MDRQYGDGGDAGSSYTPLGDTVVTGADGGGKQPGAVTLPPGEVDHAGQPAGPKDKPESSGGVCGCFGLFGGGKSQALSVDAEGHPVVDGSAGPSNAAKLT
jgi:hypothetical protein